jgi:hypothetical protein
MTEKTLQLERLCSNLAAAKHAEGEAKRQRLQFEDEISALIATKEEGVDTLDAGGFTVSVTSKLTRKLNYVAYQDIESSLPEGLCCVDLKPSINMKKLRALEMVDPNISAMFITTKPAKAAVKISLKEAA